MSFDFTLFRDKQQLSFVISSKLFLRSPLALIIPCKVNSRERVVRFKGQNLRSTHSRLVTLNLRNRTVTNALLKLSDTFKFEFFNDFSIFFFLIIIAS